MIKFYLFTLLFSSISFGAENTQSVLNKMIDIYQNKFQESSCAKFLEELEKPESDLGPAVLKEIKYYFEQKCKDPSFVPALEKSDYYAGNSMDAFCSNTVSGTGCQWNRQSARGYFILRQPSYDIEINDKVVPEKWPNYLVCAHGIHHRDYFVFADKDVIGANCVISNVVWDLYRKKSGVNYKRTDIQGLYDWLEIDTKASEIIIPDELVQQCQLIFKDSYYCTPTLIALPTIYKDQVDVCFLEGGHKTVNTPVVQLDFITSTWKCERYNLGEFDPAKPLKKGEANCIPKIDGDFKIPSCGLPYIPRMEEVNLIKKVVCPTLDDFQTIHRFNSGSQCEHPEILPYVPLRDISKFEVNEDGLKKLGDFYLFSKAYQVVFPRARVDQFYVKIPTHTENPVESVHWTCANGEAFSFYNPNGENTAYLGPFDNDCKGKVIRNISAHLKTKMPSDLIKLELFGRTNEI